MSLFRNYEGELYQSKNGWRWRLRATNGNIVADSSESYNNEEDCRDMFRKIFPFKRLVTVDK